jgi:chromosomal replication initiation ATPase DnaA
MTDQPGAYQWSSHRAYLGKDTLSWLKTDFILSQFSPDEVKARAKFAAFVGERITDGRRDEFHDERTADSRIFGDDKFVDVVLTTAEARPERKPGVSEVIAIVKKLYGLSDDQLMSQGRERVSCEARGLAEWATLEFSSGKLVELANLLRRNSSTLTCAVRRIEKLHEQDASIAEKMGCLRKELLESSCQGLTP